MKNSTEEIAGKFLGKKVEGKSQYDPSFLVAVPRQENRTYLGLNSEKYPEGFDTWYGYEFTALTNSGVPLNRVIKITYLSSSIAIVESKSLKLYLNSFNMTRLGDTFEEVLEKAREMIREDLSKLLETEVMVSFIDETSDRVSIFEDYKDLYKVVKNVDKLSVTEYKENKDLLEVIPRNGLKQEHKLVFHSLKSNCRVTHQPDYGDLFIKYVSTKYITEESLVKYLCSFRNEFHFHEEIVECAFTRLSEILDQDDELVVTALYTRRGGIDINPCRYQNFNIGSDISSLESPSVFSRYLNNIKQ